VHFTTAQVTVTDGDLARWSVSPAGSRNQSTTLTTSECSGPAHLGLGTLMGVAA
jgi:hypothetical protein